MISGNPRLTAHVGEQAVRPEVITTHRQHPHLVADRIVFYQIRRPWPLFPHPASGYLAVRRLARASILVEGRSAESSYVVLELTMKASRRRWRVDQRVVPIVLSRHAMQRYLMRCGQDLGHFQASLDAALLSIKAWLRAAAENPELLPVSLAIPIESGAVLGLPYTFRARMPWCYRLECSHGHLRKFEYAKEATLGVVLRTFIHENMYSTLQEQRLATVQHIGCELLSSLREHGSFEDEALASPAPRITQLVNAMFATTTDSAWQSAFSCPASKTPHALLTYDQ
jgi:hypothetical protein